MALVIAPATTTTVEGRSAMHAQQIPASLGLVAGEALLTAAPCYIKASDGKVYMSNGTAANEAAKVHGFTGKSYASGEPVTLWKDGIIFEYGTGLTPGATLYVGATAGRLDTAATTGDGAGVATVLTATHIQVVRTDPVAGITDLSVGTNDLAAGALAASAAGRAIMADDYFNAATADAKFTADAIGEDLLTPAELNGRVVATVANANVIGGIPVLFRINVADASADTDVVTTHKIRVVEFWFLNTGIVAHAANDTIQLKNGATAITDAIAKTATVNAIKRAGTMDPAQVEVAAGGTIRITAVKDTNAAVTAYLLAVRVA